MGTNEMSEYEAQLEGLVEDIVGLAEDWNERIETLEPGSRAGTSFVSEGARESVH